MFEKVKAITIVHRMVSDSESVINCAKEEGFLTSNYYANAECAMLALAVVFSNIYTNKEKLGNEIVREATSGTWRTFVSEKYRDKYKESIEKLSMQYVQAIQSTYSNLDLNEIQKLDAAYREICKIFANHIYAEFTAKSSDYFMQILWGVKEYVYTILGGK